MDSQDRAELLADIDALDALFSSERTWTKGELARLCDGTGTRNVNEACAWCLSGGVAKVTGYDVEVQTFNRRWRNLLNEFAVTYGDTGQMAPAWNDKDERTFADVKQLIADTRTRISSSIDSERSR